MVGGENRLPRAVLCHLHMYRACLSSHMSKHSHKINFILEGAGSLLTPCGSRQGSNYLSQLSRLAGSIMVFNSSDHKY